MAHESNRTNVNRQTERDDSEGDVVDVEVPYNQAVEVDEAVFEPEIVNKEAELLGILYSVFNLVLPEGAFPALKLSDLEDQIENVYGKTLVTGIQGHVFGEFASIIELLEHYEEVWGFYRVRNVQGQRWIIKL